MWRTTLMWASRLTVRARTAVFAAAPHDTADREARGRRWTGTERQSDADHDHEVGELGANDVFASPADPG